MRIRKGLASAALASLLAACGQSNFLAPVINGETGRQRPAVAVAGQVTVQRGDSLYKIAKRNGVALRALIDANNVAPPYTIYPGQRLNLPATGGYVVQRGDTVFGIAESHGIEPGTLVRANRIEPPYRLMPGQQLVIPGTTTRTAAAAPVRRTVASAPQASPPQTASSPSAPPVSTAPASAPVSRPEPLPPPSTQPATPSAATASSAPDPEPAPPPQPVETPVVAVGPPPSLSKSGFVWPLKGRVSSKFGAIGKGLQNDGINILANRGTPVRAVENGVVAYAGNELRGFGNLLLIKHEDGWISAYAHNDQLLVKTGERVRKGQVISRVGSTGSVDTPQLHFELRRGNRAVDPERYLSPQAALLRPREPVSPEFS